MGLAEVQAALARLFTDSDLRVRFFADPIEVGRELGLDESETTGLAARRRPDMLPSLPPRSSVSGSPTSARSSP